MPLLLPDIPEADLTPLVRQLLEIIRFQQERIQQLEDEIARLKGLKTRPVIAPSRLETPPRPPPVPGQKRPGSAKRPKTSQLIVTNEVVIPLANVPPEATFKGYEDFVVQDLIIRSQVTCYRRERWRTADGQTLVATLPGDVIPGSHFGPDLIGFILHPYHHQHVTQPLLLEQLLQLGIDISAGQLSRILTEKTEPFHQEKDQLLPAGLEVSTYVQVDDTGARHQGRNGYCTHIGNDLFATFESTDSKSRLNFLKVLRGRERSERIGALERGFSSPTHALIIVVSRHTRRKGNDHAQAQAQPTATARDDPTATAGSPRGDPGRDPGRPAADRDQAPR
jgi:hypothetical protein